MNHPLVILALVGGGVFLILILWAVVAYNGLVRLKNEVANAWSQIDVQLKRRHDLIPNLVETVKGYASHERGTLEAVIQARSRAVASTSVGDRVKAEGMLGQALVNLMALAERYPDLKANTNFLGLQEELTSTENKIGFARQFYNDCVMRFNTVISQIPSNVIASFGGFTPQTLFQIEDKEREVPKVSF